MQLTVNQWPLRHRWFKSIIIHQLNAPVVKPVDTGDLKSPELKARAGSTPARRTILNKKEIIVYKYKGGPGFR